MPLTYKGVAKGHVIELDGGATLPEGTRVSVLPEPGLAVHVPQPPLTLKEWLRAARQVRAHLPTTSDSGELLHQLRQRRARR